MMKVLNTIILLLMILGFGTGLAYAEPQSYWSWLFSLKSTKEIAPITDKLYAEECGDCHFAYQPGWLPAASWKKLLEAKALENHFEENAELDESTRKRLLDILVNNSADDSRYKRSKKVMASLGEGEVPKRITQIPYIQSKHKLVAEEIISKDSKITSLSYCDKCHKMATDANFDDDTVYIPGHGYNSW